MRILKLLVLTLAALQTVPPAAPTQGQRSATPQTAAPQQPPLTAAQCKCSVEVTVKHADTGEPVSDVDVTIVASNTNANLNAALSAAVAAGDQAAIQALVRAQAFAPVDSRSATTDSSGHAAFRDLAEGTYSVRAGRNGYLGPVSNGTAAAQTTAAARVGPSNGNGAGSNATPQPVQHVTLTLIRGATIAGKVLDANRQPASGVSVAAYRVAYRNGMKTVNQVGNAIQTDDRGEYRLYWFPPGEYLIRTITELRAAVAQNTTYPAPTYYPGTMDPSRAVPIVLREGQELGGADFSVQAITGVTVSGTIVNNMPGRVGPRGQVNRTVASVFLVPRNPQFSETPQLLSNVQQASRGRGAAPDDTNTPFEIRGVPTGTYDFYPVFNGPAADTANSSYFTGRTIIEVGSENITNVMSVIRAGVDLKGKLSIVGTPPPSPRPQTVSMANIRVNVLPLDNLPSLVSVRSLQAPPAASDGTFAIPGLIDGRYFVSGVSGMPQDAYVSDMRLGSQNFYNEGSFEIGKTAPDVMEIVVNRGGGVIQGVVQDAMRKPVGSARVVLIPDVPKRQNFLLYKIAVSLGGTGSFTFSGIAPGSYRVFAFENIPQGAEQNTEFIRQFESRGVNVTVSEGITSGNVVVQIIADQH